MKKTMLSAPIILAFGLMSCGESATEENSQGGPTAERPRSTSPDQTAKPASPTEPGTGSGSDREEMNLPMEMSGGDEPEEPAPETDPALATRLVGRYAVRKRSATIQQVPILGDSPTVNTSYGMVTVELVGDRAEMVERYCHSTSESESSIQTNIPDVVPQAMEEFRSPLTVWMDGDRVRWSRPQVVDVLGAELANPATDALPTEPSDPRVIDEDQDGHPGITVRISGFVSGEIYLVQRLVDRYEGELGADGALSGLLSDSSTSQVIDASNPILKNSAPVRPDPDASKSNLLFVPVQATMSCDALVASIPQLFQN